MKKTDIIEVTIRLARKKELPKAFWENTITRENYASDYAASDAHVDLVEAFANQHGLSTVLVNLGRRSVILSGTISEFEQAFKVTLKTKGGYRVLDGEIQLPPELKDIVKGVFGLENKPIARPMFQVAKKGGQFVSHAQSPQGFTPDQLAKIYGFPTGVTGKGQCIALIELGGGFKQADITNYFKSLKITAPIVKAIAVDGGKNSPTTADGADGEVMLDIEVAGAVAPGATIAVYFALTLHPIQIKVFWMPLPRHCMIHKTSHRLYP
jgi:kumamolisin